LEQNKKMNQKKSKSAYYLINLMIQFFVETFVAMIIGCFIGKYLDILIFEDKKILVYVFIVLGIFAGLRNFIKRALAISKGEEDEKN